VLTLGSIGLVLRVQHPQLERLGLEQKMLLAVLGTWLWVRCRRRS
jgi:hypothetical protein